jgi:hypothetical protein
MRPIEYLIAVLTATILSLTACELQVQPQSDGQAGEASAVVMRSQETQKLYTFKGVIKKSDGTFASGAAVTLMLETEIIGAAVSGSNGSFAIQDVPSSVYTLHISLEYCDDSYVTVTVPSYNNLTYIIVQSKYPAGNGQDDAAIIKKQSISGVISLQEGGYPHGASAQLYKGSALYGSTVTTNVGGSYTIYNVLNGNYTVRITFDGYQTLKIKNVIIKNQNRTNQNGIIVKTYAIGDRGPAGGWIVYAADEYEYEISGFRFIEIAPNDIGEADDKAIFGSYRNDGGLYGWDYSTENTQYIVNEYEKSKFGDIIETGLAAVYCVNFKLNGYNDWVLPTEDVFLLIKDYNDYQNYNFKLTEQYWCSNTAFWYEWYPPDQNNKTDMCGYHKFRFEPELLTEDTLDSYDRFFATPNGFERHCVRPVRFF